MPQTHFKLEKWLKQLKEIDELIFWLHFNNKEYHKLRDEFTTKGLSYEAFRFCRRNYKTFMGMAIRRLIDTHPDAISLIKLLKDLADNADAFKRSWFLIQCPDAIEEVLFIRFFGDSESLKKEVVENDIQILKCRTKKISHYADNWQAHWDKSRMKKAIEPSDSDVDRAVSGIVRVYKCYYYLLKQERWNKDRMKIKD